MVLEPTPRPELARIRAYYHETWLESRLLWLNPRNGAIHFGYWDERTRSHSESLVNMNRALASRIGIQPGQRVLDAGCSAGSPAGPSPTWQRPPSGCSGPRAPGSRTSES